MQTNSIILTKNCLKPTNLLKKSLAQVFSCKFCKIFKNTFFYRTPLVAASVLTLFRLHLWRINLTFGVVWYLGGVRYPPHKTPELTVAKTIGFSMVITHNKTHILEKNNFVVIMVSSLLAEVVILIHFMPLGSFYTPWKHQKTWREWINIAVFTFEALSLNT